MKEIYVALSEIAEVNKGPEVIEPVVTTKKEMNKELYNKVKEYKEVILLSTNLEEFSRCLNAICGILNISPNSEELIEIAEISNYIRSQEGLSIL